jgi:mRNA interferase RelE/StbE
MYKIEFTKQSLKDLSKLNKSQAQIILNKIEVIGKDPHRKNNNIKPLKGYDDKVFRLRVGDLRVIYEIIDSKLVIKVIKVQPRGSVYND